MRRFKMIVLKLSWEELPEWACKNPPPENLILKVWGKIWGAIAWASLPQVFLIKEVKVPHFGNTALQNLEDLLRRDGSQRVILVPGMVLTFSLVLQAHKPYLFLPSVLQCWWGVDDSSPVDTQSYSLCRGRAREIEVLPEWRNSDLRMPSAHEYCTRADRHITSLELKEMDISWTPTLNSVDRTDAKAAVRAISRTDMLSPSCMSHNIISHRNNDRRRIRVSDQCTNDAIS